MSVYIYRYYGNKYYKISRAILDRAVLYESFPVLIIVIGVYNDKIEKSSIFERNR